MSMSKTAAIREARTSVSIHGRRTSWTVIGPYRNNDLRGPSTEIKADSVHKARNIAAGWKAKVALGLMGRLTLDADAAVDRQLDEVFADHSIEALVAAGLAE